MSIFNPKARIIKTEPVDYIVFERLVEARKARGMDRKESAERMDIPDTELGLMENGRTEIPPEFLFKAMNLYQFPKGFFYRIKWERY